VILSNGGNLDRSNACLGSQHPSPVVKHQIGHSSCWASELGVLTFWLTLTCISTMNQLYTRNSCNRRSHGTAGYVHSAFLFGKESFLSSTTVKHRHFAPGALVSLIQKGIQYQELLAQDSSSSESTYRTFSTAELLRAHGQRRLLATPESPAPQQYPGQALQGHTSDVLAVAWSSGGVVATGAADSSVRMWHWQTSESEDEGVAIVPCDILQHLQPVPTGSPPTVHGLAWAPDGGWLATAAFDGIVRVWGCRGALSSDFEGPCHPEI
jgi:WD40 repeat protein